MSVESATKELYAAQQCVDDPRAAAAHLEASEQELLKALDDDIDVHQANAVYCDFANFVLGDWLDALLRVAPSYEDLERRKWYAVGKARINNCFAWLDREAKHGRVPGYDPIIARAAFATVLEGIDLATGAPLA